MKMFSWYSDSRETHTNLTVSFRLERGGQFESGFQDLQCIFIIRNNDGRKL